MLKPVLKIRFTGSRRVGRIARSENSPGCPLHVYEIDVPAESIHLKDFILPENLSAIDGVIICYDSSDEASFKPVEGLLRALQFQNLFMGVRGFHSPHFFKGDIAP
jgi:hypothetical protein